MKRTPTKLQLTRSHIRVLTPAQARNVIGGANSNRCATNRCDDSCGGGCTDGAVPSRCCPGI